MEPAVSRSAGPDPGFPRAIVALTLNGSTQWANAREIQRLGETRLGATPGRVREILQRAADAIASTMYELRAYQKTHPEFQDAGDRMLHEWETGMAHSLRGAF